MRIDDPSTAADFESRRLKVFFPNLVESMERVKTNGWRFAYYTTAETAFRILRNQEVWLRSTLTMNDYMEVHHGLECLRQAYGSEAGQSLQRALDACFPELSTEVRDFFNLWIPGIPRDTFVICFSEHVPEEDDHGRLSMWRAYGGRAGVALVFNTAPMFSDSDALAAYTSPVAYLQASDVAAELDRIASNIKINSGFVRELGRDNVKHSVFHMLRFASVSTKHPGFKEEREWRVIASPALEPSDLVPPSIEVINGVPQTVLKIKLQNHPDRGLTGLTLPELLHRVVIGPCDHPEVLYCALHQLLHEAGVPNPDDRIAVSGIPLRHRPRD